jgi:hypothetical protein
MARMIVATTGYNISSDLRYLSLDSNVGNLMTIDEPYINAGTSQYQHGLGYFPTTFEFFKYGSQWFPVGSSVFDLSGIFQPADVSIEYDTDKVYFTYNTIQSDIKLFISGNAADNQTGSGKNTASGKLKIAKDGFNIPDITDIRQFKFCSGLDTFKKDLALSGTTSISSNGSFNKVEITHNLGYVPVIIAKLVSNTFYSSFNNSMLPINMTLFDVTPISFYITSTKIVFFTTGFTGDMTIKYNLYRNKIA